jgi:hypothetical protein
MALSWPFQVQIPGLRDNDRIGETPRSTNLKEAIRNGTSRHLVFPRGTLTFSSHASYFPEPSFRRADQVTTTAYVLLNKSIRKNQTH